MGNIWTVAIGAAEWRMGFIVAAGFALTLAILPWWLSRVEQARWRPVRRALVESAVDAQRAGIENVAILSRQLFRENLGAPLDRLVRVRGAIERQRAEGERLGRSLAIHSPAIDPRLAALLVASVDLLLLGERTLAGLMRLYLDQAQVRVAPNVVHGDDRFGFAAGQPVALAFLAEMEALTEAFAQAAAAHREKALAALKRRERRALGAEMMRLDGLVTGLREDVRRFCARLQPTDSGCPSYRTRLRGDRVARTLDGLILRFDRG